MSEPAQDPASRTFTVSVLTRHTSDSKQRKNPQSKTVTAESNYICPSMARSGTSPQSRGPRIRLKNWLVSRWTHATRRR